MYDSATPTALALRAYERANLDAQSRRARLNQGYGLNEDGTLNGDTSGSIYQGNLDSVNSDEQAVTADRARGFAGTTGLAGKRHAATYAAAMSRQSGMLRDAFGNIADTRSQEQTNKMTYEDQLTQIRGNSDAATAQDLIDNPVQMPQVPAPNPSNPNVGLPPAVAAARVAALKKNPRAAQTAKNNRY